MVFVHDGFRNFLLCSPVVRKGGAREIRHQLSLRTEPREIHCREVSNETASHFEDTSSKSVG